jgi:hypothetical protein
MQTLGFYGLEVFDARVLVKHLQPQGVKRIPPLDGAHIARQDKPRRLPAAAAVVDECL